MRLLHAGIGLTMALYGVNSPNLAAMATPAPTNNRIEAPNFYLAIHQAKPQQEPNGSPSPNSERTLIQGNGVEFTVPAGFKGGLPSSADTKAITTEAAKMFPSLASMMQVFDSDPTFFRAIAINTTQKGNPDLVLVTRLPIPANVPLASIEEMMSKSMPSVLPPQFKLVNTKTVNVGSRQIVQLSIDADIQGSKIKESIGLFKEGDEVFQVTYVYGNENAQQAVPIFEQIINSFQATPKASPTTPPV